MSLSARLLDRLGRHISGGTVAVRHADGRETLYGKGDPRISVEITDGSLTRKLLLGGGSALGDGYVKGDWSTSDLAGLLYLASQARDRAVTGLLTQPFHRLGVWLRRFLIPHRRGPVETMAQHYDLGNDFYSAWLDPTMAYSSGLFEGTEDLEQAQKNKYRRICEMGGIGSGTRVLEIGFGWGGFAEEALSRGASVTGLTISKEQLEYAQQHLKEYSERLDLRLVDFEEAEITQHDAVVSIEMIESIEQDRWPALFETFAKATKPGGRIVLQSIVIDETHWETYRASNDFIRQYIFPGGRLPTPSLIRKHSSDAGLITKDILDFGASYAKTLAEWNRRFQAAWPSIHKGLFDETFKRMWEYYLAYCEAGFLTGRISVQQWTFLKP